MSTEADVDADLYELGLRQKDARRTLAIGVTLLVLAAGTLLGWFLVFQAVAPIVEDGRVRTGLLGAGILFGVLGVGAVVQGFRKRSEANAFEQSLRARPGV
jgi:O-antigen ligase